MTNRATTSRARRLARFRVDEGHLRRSTVGDAAVDRQAQSSDAAVEQVVLQPRTLRTIHTTAEFRSKVARARIDAGPARRGSPMALAPHGVGPRMASVALTDSTADGGPPRVMKSLGASNSARS